MPTIQNLKELPIKEIQNRLVDALPALAESDRVSEILEEHGAGLSPTLKVVADIMTYGSQDDTIRLRAAELSLKLHRVLKEDNDSARYTFNFQIVDSDVSMANILKPNR